MQNTNTIWQLLGSVPIGTVVAWFVVLSAIIGVFCTGTIKLYKVFAKYKDAKEENDELKNTVKKHGEELDDIHVEINNVKEDIMKELKEIKQNQVDSRETEIKKLRHSIITSGEKAVAARQMTIREWKSLHDMADEYIHKYKQNSYAKSLVEKVDRDVEVIGKLDEHGYDVE